MVNQKADIFNLKKIDKTLLDNISKFNLNKNLNLLHEDFEQIMYNLRDKYKKTPNQIDYRDNYLKICESLNLINNTIHEIEGTFNNYINFIKNKTYAGFYSACLVNENGWTGKRIDFSKKDYDEFTLEQFFGQLSIGYDTLGKNLLQAYWTNDLKIIKERKITPQTSCTTNVLLYFMGKNMTCDSIYNGFSQWYDENNIAKYGYSKKITNESLGNITIGKLKYIDGVEIDLDSLNFEDKLLIVDKIKNKTLKKYIPILL